MSINKHLITFLEENVNINQSRLDTANTNIAWVTTVIENSEIFSPILVKDPSPQGSLRHETIIKPVHEDDIFDTDLLVEIKKPSDWSYRDCLVKMWKIFSDHWTYKDKLNTDRTRCITIDYEWENSLDIVPTFQEDGEYYIVNRVDNVREISDGEGFSTWFDEQNKKTNNNLKKVIRLFKYIRNYKGLFEIMSIHLNVLIGKAVDVGWDFTDVQTTLTSIVNNLYKYLEDKTKVEELDLINPANPNEDMWEGNRNLDDAELLKFKSFIKDLYDILCAGLDDESIVMKLRKFLGDEFWDIYFEDISKSQGYQWEEIVESLSLKGRNIKWHVRVENATYKKRDEQGKLMPKVLRSSYQINTGIDLDFTCTVLWISWDYQVYWQVLNTWPEALVRENEGKSWFRGDIFTWRSRNSVKLEQHKNEETTSFKWVHWVKCYVVQSNFLVAESKKFFVRIV